MTNLKHTLIALAALATFTVSASAQGMSKAEHATQKAKIETEFKAAKDACKPLAGQANSACLTKAKGVEKTAKAELEMQFKPNEKTRYNDSIAKAEVAYDNAREACNEKTDNAKDVCVKEAKAAETAAKADAKVQRTATKANAKATESKSSAKESAADDKNTAQYKVAMEKCDGFSGDAKTTCQDQAKKTYVK
jgi:hypothetical protein